MECRGGIVLNRSLGCEDIMLFALDNSLASELAGVLAFERRTFRSAPFDPAAEGVTAAVPPGTALVFCSADRETYTLLLNLIKQRELRLPVVVVSRQPQTDEWLDAIEAGAADYCSPPFEAFQISWIIDNTLKYRQAAAA
jgi:DNA-binding NtrC family response regulator